MTLQEIADAAGVGITTVSHALRGAGRISPSRREQIRQLATDMGYEPRAAAQLMRAKRTGRLAIVVAEPDPEYAIRWTGFGGLVATVMKQCQQRGVRCDLDFCPMGETEAEFAAPEHFAGGFADGAIVMGWTGPYLKRWLDMAQREPWVHLTEPSEYCVLNDDTADMHMVADHLAALGHKRIALTHGSTRYETHRARCAAFDEAAHKHGFEVDRDRWIFAAGRHREYSLPDRINRTVQWAESILKDSPRPTACIFGSGLHARAIIEAARRLNVAVPEQLSIAGPGDELNAYRSFPPLTTVGRDMDEMARRAVDLLLARIADDEVESGTRWVQPTMVVRQSTAPAPDN